MNITPAPIDKITFVVEVETVAPLQDKGEITTKDPTIKSRRINTEAVVQIDATRMQDLSRITEATRPQVKAEGTIEDSTVQIKVITQTEGDINLTILHTRVITQEGVVVDTPKEADTRGMTEIISHINCKASTLKMELNIKLTQNQTIVNWETKGLNRC